jgi:DNA excision repair protein ERCC-1
MSETPQYLDGGGSSNAAAAGGSQQQPTQQRKNGGVSAAKIHVNERQRTNPLISNKLIRNVEWEFAPGITPDFVLGATTCALFLSLRYHLLKPTYIIQRIEELRGDFRYSLMIMP